MALTAHTEPPSGSSIDTKSEEGEASKGQRDANGEQTKPKPRPKRPRKPDYARIHSKPLPLEVYPLPTFIPQNPLSLLRIAYVLLRDYLSPRSSISCDASIGYFSTATRSVHITDPKHIRALWEMGFFGKGTLSRSEPSWLEREKARLREGKGGTSEEATRARREERRMFKLERARLEREAVELQRAKERGDLANDVKSGALEDDQGTEQAQPKVGPASEAQPEEAGLNHVFPWIEKKQQKEEKDAVVLAIRATPPSHLQHVFPWMTQEAPAAEVEILDEHVVEPEKVVPPSPQVSEDKATEMLNGHAMEPAMPAPKVAAARKAAKNPNVSVSELPEAARTNEETEEQGPDLTTNQEHLQLCLEEAFFLAYGLGALAIQASPTTIDDASPSPRSHSELLSLFATHAVFPPCSPTDIQPDNPFLLNYVVYHHYRSLGWVVRPGSKFSCDFLLYNRGPVFSHAEFALLIIPEYAQGVEGKRKDWWWLHCVNRVQSQVRKTLVLCYVEVPRTLEGMSEGDIGRVLKGYKIREFVIKRWLANRSRD
ncbi:hypothetical protein MBLNU457_g1033t1 [Dothideomycetes sp. NU457]